MNFSRRAQRVRNCKNTFNFDDFRDKLKIELDSKAGNLNAELLED